MKYQPTDNIHPLTQQLAEQGRVILALRESLDEREREIGRLWVYVRDDRNAGSSQPPAVWFTYSPDRKGIHPQSQLAGFSGVLQADAYAGFNDLYHPEREVGAIREAACMAHDGRLRLTGL
ncbi:transposase IS66 family protein [Biostraticola tofi]|uniref:Transposase IS66 family protein n=1 Tax=Biostraticola tofi TaxID=466109 RepID=A0A4R3YUU9_9GAMM|nr:transposase IS66 family protein [Biostraticola tofi]